MRTGQRKTGHRIGIVFTLLMSLGITKDAFAQEGCTRSRLTYTVTLSLGELPKPCEMTLRPNGVVTVVIRGANEALAKFDVNIVSIQDQKYPATPLASPKTGEPPKQDVKAEPPKVDPNTMGAANQGLTWSTLGVQATARNELLEVIEAIAEHHTQVTTFLNVDTRTRELCFGHQAPTEVGDAWTALRAVNAVAGSAHEALLRVRMPVRAGALQQSQGCAGRIRATYGQILDATAVQSRHAEARTQAEALRKENAALRTRVTEIGSELDPKAREALALVNEKLAAMDATLVRVLADELSADNLARAKNLMAEAVKQLDLVDRSTDVVVRNIDVDGTRGRSRNIVLQWAANQQTVPVESGSRTLVVDRFTGLMLNVGGSAGIAGLRTHESIRRAAFDTAGAIVADSVDLLPNSYMSWTPSISGGVSATYHLQNGFFAGVGLDLMMLKEGSGDATARVAFPIFHFGRDDIRVFFGTIRGPRTRHVLDSGESLRIAAADPDPDNLILRNFREGALDGIYKSFVERLYLGIVVGTTGVSVK